MSERIINIDKQGQCPFDDNMTITSRFDTTFRDSNGEETQAFGLSGNLCSDCNNIFVDPEVIKIVRNDENSKCVFAIENDLAYRERLETE